MNEDRPKSHIMLSLAVVAAVAYLVGFLLFASALPGPPAKIENADGIVALTGGGARLDMATALFERGVGKRLLISGVHPSTTKSEIRQIAHGGPRFDCCVDLGFGAANTHGNAAEAAAWSHAHHYKSLVIVTASYHMPRSLAEFQAEMPNMRLESYPVEPDGVDLHRWWRDGKALHLLQAEYAKYLASLVLTTFTGKDRRAALDRSAAWRNAPTQS